MSNVTTATPDATALEAVIAIEAACRESETAGIAGIGAAAAIRAMSYHWADHLSQGHGTEIIDADIQALIGQLAVVRSELAQRFSAA